MYQEDGFSLVEVLIASVIMMLGVTGYVTLQSEYVIADRNLNLRSLAMHIAQEKIHDLYYFEQLTLATGKRSYSEILNNKGGDTAAGTRLVKVSNNISDEHEFVLNWSVLDKYFVDSNFDGVADTWIKQGHVLLPKVLPPFADIKVVSVEVTWVDLTGNVQTVVVASNIAPIQQSNSFQVLYRDNSVTASP